MGQFFNSELCAKCRGRGWCKQPCIIYSKIKNYIPKTKTHFSGPSPPEIFVGRFDYPNIQAGILTPDNLESESAEEISELAFPEVWHEKRLSIDRILENRAKLVYGKFKTQIKMAKTQNRFIELMQEISLAYKPVSTEFFLKRPPQQKLEISKSLPLIGNPAPLDHARLEENPQVKPKVDYLVNDTDSKSTQSILELYQSQVSITNINKILSAGLLGLKTQRRLVPTRWAITAVDDTLSKSLLKKIKYYPEINEILLFNSEYNGNHYEILVLPDKFSFEVLEAEVSGSLWNRTGHVSIMQDYEFFNGRKKYANEVTGAYYATRLAFAEYLERIKKQATAILFREVREEYNAPLGVGILREITRQAFNQQPEKFPSIESALNHMQSRLHLPVNLFKDKSILLKQYKKQTRLNKWF